MLTARLQLALAAQDVKEREPRDDCTCRSNDSYRTDDKWHSLQDFEREYHGLAGRQWFSFAVIPLDLIELRDMALPHIAIAVIELQDVGQPRAQIFAKP
jgi:hypothetical protein